MKRAECGVRGVAVLSLLCALALQGCCSKPGLGAVDVSAYEKVRVHAENTMALHFDRRSDAGPLRQFYDASADADDRQDLIRTWRAVDPLGSDHPDLLQSGVFDKAMAEPNWPSESVDEKAVFVAGTRDATESFLAGDSE